MERQVSQKVFQASVTYEPFHSEIREFSVPAIARDSGFLRVEAAGVCGSDINAHSEPAPERILGHENVGIIEQLGAEAADRWGLEVGDRVVVEEYLPCGRCGTCRTTDFRFCFESDPSEGGIRYGSTGISIDPGLWGGFSQYMYLHPRSVLHRAPLGVSAEYLTLALPLGNGFEWACIEGRSGPGKTVVIYGPGQQGLASVYAAKKAGADMVVLLGTSRDSHRLSAGLALGADVVVNVDGEDPVSVVRGLTRGAMADLVIDTARGDAGTLSGGIAMLKQRGALLYATAQVQVAELPLSDAQWKTLTLKGVRGHSYAAVEWAIGQIESNHELLSVLSTGSFGLNDVDTAIRATAGETDLKSIHVSILPWS